MNSLLYKLYSGEYDFNPERDGTQQQLYKKRYEEWDKVQRVFGDEFIERVFRLEGELSDRRAFQCYREGFTLGVRLMIEALTSATG